MIQQLAHTLKAYWLQGHDWYQKPWVEWGLKLGLTGSAGVYIGLKMAHVSLLATWEGIWQEQGWLLGLVICFLPLNLACEGQKYVILVRKLYPLSWSRAMLGILAGMPLGLLTPNRVGEYVGRLWVLPADQRWAGGTFTFINRSAQMFVTLLLGIIAMEAYVEETVNPPRWMAVLRGVSWGLGFIWMGIAGVGLWQIQHPGLNRLPLVHRLLPALRAVGIKSLGQIIWWSLLRNLIFVGQYILLLYACGYTDGIGTAFLMVWMVFLLKSLIPIASFAELGIRESVAMTVMALFGVGEAISFSSTFILYTVNILLPALVGLICLNYLKTS